MTIEGIIRDCETYWQEVGLPHATARDMASELEMHLREAANDGRSPGEVVGTDVAAFAKAWAAEQRSDVASPLPSWKQIQRRAGHKEPTKAYVWAIAGAIVAIAVTAVLTTGEESTVDNEVWRWVWTIFALVMAIGEIFTAAFFLLPFAVGGAFAAAAAWMGLGVTVQWVAFFATTIASMLYLRRYIRIQQADEGLKVGPVRYIGMRATVLEEIDMAANTGRIRVESEEWRAIVDGDEVVPAGTTVEVAELRGTRLVVVVP